jgi:hypothetical protein
MQTAVTLLGVVVAMLAQQRTRRDDERAGYQRSEGIWTCNRCVHWENEMLEGWIYWPNTPPDSHAEVEWIRFDARTGTFSEPKRSRVADLQRGKEPWEFATYYWRPLEKSLN